jgi:hypothetical protein
MCSSFTMPAGFLQATDQPQAPLPAAPRPAPSAQRPAEILPMALPAGVTDDQRNSAGWSPMDERDEAGKRLDNREFLDLQLRFVEVLASRVGRPLGETVGLYTNFHRRFGLGLVQGVPTTARWAEYVERLEVLPDHAARLDWTQECARDAVETPPPGDHRFGCFAVDRPDDQAVVSIHFANLDDDGVGPLHHRKVDRRRGELRDLWTFVREAYPAAESVRGGSWLYHLEAYRRLFPPAYVASRRLPERALSFQGYSSWGQFLDHRGHVRPAVRDAFLAKLPHLDPQRIGLTFPLPALVVDGPIAGFYAWYGLNPPDSARS